MPVSPAIPRHPDPASQYYPKVPILAAHWLPIGPTAQDGTLSIEEIQKGIAESAVDIPADLIEIMSLGQRSDGITMRF